MMKKIIVYGDIHGCLDELKELRERIKPSSDDIEISVGDFLNKGFYSLETFHYMLDNEIKSIIGNNEIKIIKLYKRYKEDGQKYLETLKEFEIDTVLKITDNEVKYIENLPYFLKFSNLTIVHAGLKNDTVLDDNLDKNTKRDITLLRYFNKDFEPISWEQKEQRYKFWSEIYDGNQGFVVHGHHPFDQPRIEKFAIGIDTGAVYGKKLTAVQFSILKDGSVDTKNYQFFSVDAKMDYWKFWVDGGTLR